MMMMMMITMMIYLRPTMNNRAIMEGATSLTPPSIAFSTCNTGTGCEPGQFQCLSGGCISIDLLCDSNPDCPDDSDETADCEGTVPCPLPDNTTVCQLRSIGCGLDNTTDIRPA
ncbi:hypothetical protein DPMN_190691 [Dreissena polymorpha]|uniref:Uncharacterized protein n=1 Tax=Dreissena polymorpha TaxID=45954 RepID=A0A9D4BD66_DREPO|nr:hypothetical protein DPMN_190691 [Dreissena polymorpha]